MTKFEPKSGFRAVRIPQSLFMYHKLTSLSPNALRLFLYIGYRACKTLNAEVTLQLVEMKNAVLLTPDSILAASKEIKSFGLADFRIEGTKSTFYLLQPDGSRVATYCRQPLPTRLSLPA